MVGDPLKVSGYVYILFILWFKETKLGCGDAPRKKKIRRVKKEAFG